MPFRVLSLRLMQPSAVSDQTGPLQHAKKEIKTCQANQSSQNYMKRKEKNQLKHKSSIEHIKEGWLWLWLWGFKKFQENEDGRKSLRFEGYGVYSLEGRKSLQLCLVRLYRDDDGFQGEEVMVGVLATARKEM
ncbi:unnamed protein product [Prunus armeniaca]